MSNSSTMSGTETPPEKTMQERGGEVVTPNTQGKPWMYKSLKLGPLTIPAYASAEFQLIFISLVCFLCPGMFNAVNGLGAGGLVDPHDINNANTALYAMFAGVGFFAGSIANRIGLRLTLGFGGFGYALYIASILSYNHNGNAGFLIFAGALLGLCAGLLWTAQGALMLGLPLEWQKGRFISIFWMIFNLGGVIGSLIPLAQNIHSTSNKVNDGTYIAFIVLMALGFVLAAFLCNPHHIVRQDGSRLILQKNPSWKTEIMGLFECLRTDWYIILLFPMFISSNWFYTYHFQDVNLPKFNIRTRSLNNVLYWTAQILGALVIGFALDNKALRRTVRAKILLVVLFLLTLGIWGGGYAFQRNYTRESTDETLHPDYVKLDWSDSSYIGPMFLYIFYGFYDAAWQTSVYWLMGSLTNNGRKLANFTGFYKGIQSAGGAIAANIDARGLPFMTEFGINWGLLLGGLLFAAPVVWMKVKDTTSLEDDLAFSDETKADVMPVGPVVAAEVRMGEKTVQH